MVMAARSMRASEARRRSFCRDANLGLLGGTTKFMTSVIILLAGP
jgi:hypothetical protein